MILLELASLPPREVAADGSAEIITDCWVGGDLLTRCGGENPCFVGVLYVAPRGTPLCLRKRTPSHRNCVLARMIVKNSSPFG